MRGQKPSSHVCSMTSGSKWWMRGRYPKDGAFSRALLGTARVEPQRGCVRILPPRSGSHDDNRSPDVLTEVSATTIATSDGLALGCHAFLMLSGIHRYVA